MFTRPVDLKVVWIVVAGESLTDQLDLGYICQVVIVSPSYFVFKVWLSLENTNFLLPKINPDYE